MTTARRTSRYRGTGRAAAPLAAGVIVWAFIGPVAAWGEQPLANFRFVNNCDEGFTCTGESGQRSCWCEMDWNDISFWQMCWGISYASCTDEDPPVSYPDEFDENVKIEHSTTDSRCDGGADHGDLCTDDGDCTDVCVGGTWGGLTCEGAGYTKCINGGGTCPPKDCEPEQYLLINLTEDAGSNPITILNLLILPESGGGDELDIRFASKDASNTLTAYTVTVDATNGDVDVTMTDSAEINTDTAE